MGMSVMQSSAFKAASGEMDISTLHLLSLGLLFAVLFLWAAWALLDVWAGWSNE
ncbi:MAG: TIGR03758 family integrating conjugative element protein, partial [Oliverpabstia sp.]